MWMNGTLTLLQASLLDILIASKGPPRRVTASSNDGLEPLEKSIAALGGESAAPNSVRIAVLISPELEAPVQPEF